MQLISTFPHYNPYKFAACTHKAMSADSCNLSFVAHMYIQKKCCLVSIITGSIYVMSRFHSKNPQRCRAPCYTRRSIQHTGFTDLSSAMFGEYDPGDAPTELDGLREIT